MISYLFCDTLAEMTSRGPRGWLSGLGAMPMHVSFYPNDVHLEKIMLILKKHTSQYAAFD